MTRAWLALSAAVGLVSAACSPGRTQPGTTQGAVTSGVRPSILLVTLDTTRADAMGPDAVGVQTPTFNALASRGRRYRQAYAAVPETLPSHASMMTGLYPGGHGVHENGRFLSATHTAIAERLHGAGYRTLAFVSAFSLARRFGLARGFDTYDDETPPGLAERSARLTTDAVLAHLSREPRSSLFLWVHYYDPHAPYAPPEPFATQYRSTPYLGEVAAMDQELGRLVAAFEQHVQGPSATIVVGDHGEGLGDHGESQHGYLLYQPTMRVPLVVVGPGVAPGESDVPVSTRRVFHTLLDLAGLEAAGSLRGPLEELVVGEAMKPFLEFGWQPQVMGVDGRRKAILTGRLEIYDLVDDPRESKNVVGRVSLPAAVRTALDQYPIPSPEAAKAPDALDEESRRKLASLGYVSASAAPTVRKDAPRPADMTHLFDVIEKASGLFATGQYAQAIPVLEQIRAADPYNLDAALRLATAHSSLGHDARAVETFKQAAAIAPRSPDVRLYLALHYAKTHQWEAAAPLLEGVLSEMPERLPALEGLADIRERQNRPQDAIALRLRINGLRPPSAAELGHLGELQMSVGSTAAAIESFERARATSGAAFTHDLELGVLYLDAKRFADAAAALDRVPASHPGSAMALFKRAQVSVLLGEPDQAARIAQAKKRADATTRELIARERLFR